MSKLPLLFKSQVLSRRKNCKEKMKGWKASGLEGIAVELLKYGGDSKTEWFLRILIRYMVISTVLEDWKGACFITVYKGRGEYT